MSTQIKRLQQSGTAFVPITLSEAVVVNCTDLPGLSSYGITTLERVLRAYLGIMGTNAGDIGQLKDQINEILENKQDKLIPGNGIEILPNGVINATFSTTLYEVVSTLPVPPTAQNLNKIYIVPSQNAGDIDKYLEFICVQEGDNYYWEQIGSVTSEVNLDGYLTKIEFGQWISTSSIQAVDVTSSGGQIIELEYDIPATLHDYLV